MQDDPAGYAFVPPPTPAPAPAGNSTTPLIATNAVTDPTPVREVLARRYPELTADLI